MTICVMVAILVTVAEQGLGLTEFKDGGVYNINYRLDDNVSVDYGAPGMKTTVNLLDEGFIGLKFNAYQDSQINIFGGSVYGYLNAQDRSHVTMSGGSLGNFLQADMTSQVTISGGSVGGCLHACSSSQVTMSGGLVDDDLWARDYGQITMLGGTVGYNLHAQGYGRITMSSGSVGNDLYAEDYGQITMSGGTISSQGLGILLSANSKLIIEGFDFAIDGSPVGFFEITSILGGSYGNEPVRHLTGILASGDLLDNDFRIGNDAKIVLVPEPSTFLLLGFSVVILRKRA